MRIQIVSDQMKDEFGSNKLLANARINMFLLNVKSLFQFAKANHLFHAKTSEFDKSDMAKYPLNKF